MLQLLQLAAGRSVFKRKRASKRISHIEGEALIDRPSLFCGSYVAWLPAAGAAVGAAWAGCARCCINCLRFVLFQAWLRPLELLRAACLQVESNFIHPLRGSAHARTIVASATAVGEPSGAA